MNAYKKTKLIYKVLLFVLPFLVLSITMTGIILSWTTYTHFQKTINTDYENIIKSSAGEIRLFMRNAQKGLEGLAWVIAATKLNRWQKEMAIAAFSHTATEFMSMSLISTQGKEVISVGREKGDVNFSQSGTFRKALTGKRAISGVMWTKENIPYIHVAAPILHLGEVKEVLWGEFNLKSVWDVLEGVKVGDTGQVAIMDLSGQFIGHMEMDRVVRGRPEEASGVLKKLRTSSTPVVWVEEKDETKLHCLGYRIPDLDWVIVLSQAYPEIYAYLYQNIRWGILITCLICLLAILLGWHRVRHFLTPIHTLHRQVERIGQGDLDQRASVDSHDEIGDLALAFNEMTDSLKTFIRREVETARELAHSKNLAILGTTSSKVTHEVGNLLNNVGLTLAILKGEGLSQKGENALHVLEKDSKRVRHFIHDFLQFAKKPDVHLERVSIDKTIREVLFVHQANAKQNGIQLDLNWPSDLPPVNIDTRLMYQTLNNLVKNALEAVGGPGKISIEGRIEEQNLVVMIEDTGLGVAPEILEQMFDPFFTTKGKKGTGLGLSVVKTIVEAHRGTIECHSELKKGTTFVLRLPLGAFPGRW
ncbi:MAG: sensor histidine kinase [Deltaproteobacteria bacterium]|nr:sensor histidine kinase [Deltaproteobacteria bacterium]